MGTSNVRNSNKEAKGPEPICGYCLHIPKRAASWSTKLYQQALVQVIIPRGMKMAPVATAESQLLHFQVFILKASLYVAVVKLKLINL